MSVIGIDIGTTTICALELDPASGSVQNILKRDNVFLDQAAYSQDPDRITGVVKELLECLWNDDVTDIAISSQMHGILFADDRGRAVTQFYTWKNPWGNLPRDGSTYAETMAAVSGHGCVTALYMNEHGLIPERAKVLCNIGDYVAMQLTGTSSPQMNVTIAESIGCFDRNSLSFKADVLASLGMNPQWFPNVHLKDHVCGVYRSARVHAAFGDNQCSFLGSVENYKTSVCVNVGTGQQVSCYHPEYLPADGVDVRSFFNMGYLYVGVSQNGGKNYERFIRFMESAAALYTGQQIDGYEKTWEIWRDRKQNSSPVVTSALYGPVGTAASGTVILENLSENTGVADVIDGYVLGMARELRDLYLRIPEGIRRGKEKIFASGSGIVKNKILWQYVRELFGTELHREIRAEAAAAGAAICVCREEL